MRALWSGSLSFGLVNIPVKLYSASRDKRLAFTLLRKEDLCPIGFQRVCKVTGEQVAQDDIVRGFAYEKGEYVVVEPDDFKRANARKTSTIDVLDFVNEAEIAAKYYEKPYYLEPDPKAESAYALLRDALKQSKRVGVAKFVLREREHLGVITVEGDILMLNQLRFHDEIVEPGRIWVPGEVKVTERELRLAMLLIDELTRSFDPKRYHDEYTEELRRVIDAKVAGKVPAKKGQAPVPTAVPDLLEVLRQSLEGTRGRAPAKEKTKAKSAPRKKT